VTAATVATFIIAADHAGREYELAQYQIGSGTELSKVAHQAEQAEHQLGLDTYGRPAQRNSASASTTDALLAWGTANKYKVVFGAWAASMVGSFGCESQTGGELRGVGARAARGWGLQGLTALSWFVFALQTSR